MNLQLSELQGANYIEAGNVTLSTINISDDIEKNTTVDVSVTGDPETSTINLDTTLEHLSSGLAANKQQFKWPLDQQQPNLLKVVSKNSLSLGKSSWMEMMRLQMAAKQNDKV